MDVAVMAETAPALALVSTGDARPADASTEPTESTEVFAALLAALLTQPATPAPLPGPEDAAAGADAEAEIAVAPIALAVTVPVAAAALPQRAVPTAPPAADLAADAPAPLPVPADLLPVDGALPVAVDAKTSTEATDAPIGDAEAVAPPAELAPVTPAVVAPTDASTGGATDTIAEREPAPPVSAAADARPAAPTPEAVAVTAASATVRAPAPRAVDAPVAPAPVRPAPPPDPAAQIVRAIAPLRKLGDGTHRVVLELRPVDLGIVRVELSLASGVVHLGMRAEADATGELLRAAMPGLRAQLDAAGLSTGRLSVDAGADGRGRSNTEWAAASGDADGRRRTPADAGDHPAEHHSSPYASTSHGLVDVLL